jgi:hypothetical protein
MTQSKPSDYTIAKFLDYIRAFNKHDYDLQHAFYAPDVQLKLPKVENKVLVGSEGIKSHYLPLFTKWHEIITPIDLIIDNDQMRMFFWMETNFAAKEDLASGELAPGGFTGVKKGGVVRLTVWAHYINDPDSGLMKEIQTCEFDKVYLGTGASLEKRVEESRSRARKDLLLDWNEVLEDIKS